MEMTEEDCRADFLICAVQIEVNCGQFDQRRLSVAAQRMAELGFSFEQMVDIVEAAQAKVADPDSYGGSA